MLLADSAPRRLRAAAAQIMKQRGGMPLATLNERHAGSI